MSSTELLAAAGVAMFGGQWKAGLGRILGVTDRTINRWLSGKVEPRPGVFVDLLKVLQERRGEISRLIGATGFFIHQGNLSITFSSARVDHRSDPGPVSRVVVGRVVLPVGAAAGLAVG